MNLLRHVRSALMLVVALLAAALLAGCGGGEGPGVTTDRAKQATTGDESPTPTSDEADGEGEPAASVPADLRFTMTEVGSKAGGAGAGMPANLACTRSIPATCRGELACPVEEDAAAWHQDACGYLAEHADELLPEDPAMEAVACTQQYGGPERMLVEGTVDGEAVTKTLTRTDGCQIAAWERWAPVWGQPDPSDSDRPECPSPKVPPPPDSPVSSDDPCRAQLDDDMVVDPGEMDRGAVTELPPVEGSTRTGEGGEIQPETHEDPPSAFR